MTKASECVPKYIYAMARIIGIWPSEMRVNSRNRFSSKGLKGSNCLWLAVVLAIYTSCMLLEIYTLNIVQFYGYSYFETRMYSIIKIIICSVCILSVLLGIKNRAEIRSFFNIIFDVDQAVSLVEYNYFYMIHNS